jgi:hypothetical protein
MSVLKTIFSLLSFSSSTVYFFAYQFWDFHSLKWSDFGLLSWDTPVIKILWAWKGSFSCSPFLLAQTGFRFYPHFMLIRVIIFLATSQLNLTDSYLCPNNYFSRGVAISQTRQPEDSLTNIYLCTFWQFLLIYNKYSKLFLLIFDMSPSFLELQFFKSCGRSYT